MTGQPELRVRSKPEEVEAGADQAVGEVGEVHNRQAAGAAHKRLVGAVEGARNRLAEAAGRNTPAVQQSRTRNLGRHPNRHARFRSYQ